MQVFARSASVSVLKPNTLASPAVFTVSPVTMPMSVVFPAPFGPKSPKKSPSAMEKFTPLSASVPVS